VADLLRFAARNHDEMLGLVGQHLALVGIAVAVAVAIGIPLGVLATRHRALERPVLGVASVLQTIPSLALFGFLIPVPLVGGVGARAAIFALIVYALLPIVRNTHAGIRGIDPALREAARGMGMTDRQLLWKVELPLSVGVVLAGVRVATVISVGIATIAAAIGAGGLGVYIFRGIAVLDDTLILAGAVPAALLALAADGLLGWLGHRLAPPGAPGGRAPASVRPA
jgi:osmoprotectant transport system permease protein